MIADERKQELADYLASQLERYIDKQWIDVGIKEDMGSTPEEREWVRTSLSCSVVTHY